MACSGFRCYGKRLERTGSTRSDEGPDEETKAGKWNGESLQCEKPFQLIRPEEAGAELEAPVEKICNHLRKHQQAGPSQGMNILTNLVVVPEDSGSEL
jgi:hypothetical protein